MKAPLPANMQVRIERRIDAGKIGPDGNYDRYYEYDILMFVDSDVSSSVRSYTDSPTSPAFSRSIQARTGGD